MLAIALVLDKRVPEAFDRWEKQSIEQQKVC
jgi:hypothetical protein